MHASVASSTHVTCLSFFLPAAAVQTISTMGDEELRLCREALYRDLRGNNPEITEVTVGRHTWVGEGDLLGRALMNSEVVSCVVFNLCEMAMELRQDLDPGNVLLRMASLLMYLSENQALQKVSVLCTFSDTWNAPTINPCIDLICDCIFTALAKRATLTHFVFGARCSAHSSCAFLSGPTRLKRLTLSGSIDMGIFDPTAFHSKIAQAVSSQSELTYLHFVMILRTGLVSACLQAICDRAPLKELSICSDKTHSCIHGEREIEQSKQIADGLRINVSLVRVELLCMRVERCMEVLLSYLFDHPNLEEIVLRPKRGLVTAPPLALSNLLRSTQCRIRQVVLEGFAFDAQSWTLLLDSIEARSTSTGLTVRACSFSGSLYALLAQSLPQNTKLRELALENLDLSDIHASALMQVFCRNGSLFRTIVDGMPRRWCRKVKAYGQRNQYFAHVLPEVGCDGNWCISLLPLVYISALKAPRMAPTTMLIGLLAWKDNFPCRFVPRENKL
jgi:hypothetical protein